MKWLILFSDYVGLAVQYIVPMAPWLMIAVFIIFGDKHGRPHH